MTRDTDLLTARRLHGVPLPAFAGPMGRLRRREARCLGCDVPVSRSAPRGLCGVCGKLEAKRECEERLARVLPEVHHGARFDTVRAWCHDERAIRWVQSVAERAPACATVTLWGSTGAGKSTLAAALLRALVTGPRRHASMAWTDARDIAMARRNHRLGHGDPPEIERAIEADLLVLDELGKETTGKMYEPADVVMVLDERYRRRDGALTIVTTEWAASGDAPGMKLSDLYMPSLVRRLTEPWRAGPPPVGAAIVVHVRRKDEMR